MKREEAIQVLQTALTSPFIYGEYAEAIDMAIEALNCSEKPNGSLISRQDAIEAVRKVWCDNDDRNDFKQRYYEMGNNDAVEDAIGYIDALPSAEPKTDEENELKFYYVESIDDYWIGRRLDNFYYADWHDGLGFVWSHSRYLPWGEHIVDENTLWKEHTYPSEPIEVPFTEWIVGFVKKYFAEPKTGEWEYDPNGMDWNIPAWRCSECGYVAPHIGIADKGIGSNPMNWAGSKYCPECGCKIVGARMRGEEE